MGLRRRAGRQMRAALVAVALLAAACGGRSSPLPEPTAEGVYGLDWSKLALDAGGKDPTTTTPPYEDPGSLGHPGHYQGGEAALLDVACGHERIVAVGYLAKDIVADTWSSPDGLAWARSLEVPSGPGSLATAVATGDSGFVAAGRSGTDAAFWRSADGRSWTVVDGAAALVDPAELQATAITAVGDGFVAGGWAGAIIGDVRSAFWWSADGTTVERVDADDGTVADARVAAIASSPDGTLLAVGLNGDAQHTTGSTAWHSSDGRSWKRAPAPIDGRMNGLTWAEGIGWVAVGSDLEARRAIAWTSTDGETWVAAPDAPGLNNFELKIEMHDVAWDGEQLIAVGHRLFGTQYPTADAWLSNDGVTWTRANEGTSFSQGRLMAVCNGGPGLVGVGDYGSPDFAVPTVWVSPPSGS